MNSATICLNIAGVDCYAEIAFICTSKGHPGTPPSMTDPGDPPEPPEFEIRSMELFEDIAGAALNNQLDLPDWLRVAIEDRDETYEAMRDAWDRDDGFDG